MECPPTSLIVDDFQLSPLLSPPRDSELPKPLTTLFHEKKPKAHKKSGHKARKVKKHSSSQTLEKLKGGKKEARQPRPISKQKAFSLECLPPFEEGPSSPTKLTQERSILVRSEGNLPQFSQFQRRRQEKEDSARLRLEFQKTIRLELDLRKPEQPEIIVHSPSWPEEGHGGKSEKPSEEEIRRKTLRRAQSVMIGKEFHNRQRRPPDFISSEDIHSMSLGPFQTLRTKKPVKKFNSALEGALADKWKKEKKPPLNQNVLTELTRDYCFEIVFGEFYNESLAQLSAQEFEMEKEEHAVRLLEEIAHKGVPLMPIIQRYNIFLKALKEHFEETNEKTSESRALYESLEQLILNKEDLLESSSGIDLANFLSKYQEIAQGKLGGKFNDFITLPLGAKRKSRIEILQALKLWARPTPEFRRKFYNEIETLCQNLVRARNIPFVNFLWSEDPKAKRQVSEIAQFDVLRSLMFGESVLFQRICVNGKTVFDEDETVPPKPKDDKGEIDEVEIKRDFYHNLFTKLAETDLGTYTRREIKREVESALALLGKDSSSVKRRESSILKALIPCSITAWMPAFNYLQFLFPQFYKLPFRVRECKEEGSKALTCDIEVEGPNDYKVLIERMHVVYEADKHDAVIDRDKPLAFFPVQWEMSPVGAKQWQGCLSISSHLVFTEHASTQQRRSILNILGNPSDPKLCAGKKDEWFGLPTYKKEFKKREDAGVDLP